MVLAMLVAGSLAFRLLPEKPSPQIAPFEGNIPTSGSARVTSSGGNVTSLTLAAAARGCTLESFEAVTSSGDTFRYTVGAPAQTNASFAQAFPDDIMPHGTGLVLDCK